MTTHEILPCSVACYIYVLAYYIINIFILQVYDGLIMVFGICRLYTKSKQSYDNGRQSVWRKISQYDSLS